MSYCKVGPDSDVYVFQGMAPRDKPIWYCHGCRMLDAGRHYTADAREVMLAHLQEHELKGHKVPQHALDRLLSEIMVPPCPYWGQLIDATIGRTSAAKPDAAKRCGKCRLCQRYGQVYDAPDQRCAFWDQIADALVTGKNYEHSKAAPCGRCEVCRGSKVVEGLING